MQWDDSTATILNPIYPLSFGIKLSCPTETVSQKVIFNMLKGCTKLSAAFSATLSLWTGDQQTMRKKGTPHMLHGFFLFLYLSLKKKYCKWTKSFALYLVGKLSTPDLPNFLLRISLSFPGWYFIQASFQCVVLLPQPLHSFLRPLPSGPVSGFLLQLISGLLRTEGPRGTAQFLLGSKPFIFSKARSWAPFEKVLLLEWVQPQICLRPRSFLAWLLR